jgi:hypothetical protein
MVLMSGVTAARAVCEDFGIAIPTMPSNGNLQTAPQEMASLS